METGKTPLPLPEVSGGRSQAAGRDGEMRRQVLGNVSLHGLAASLFTVFVFLFCVLGFFFFFCEDVANGLK